jgi:hypothetical protein
VATLAELKAEIASDLRRSNLSTEIAAAITAAISDVDVNRFWFNETRKYTFQTVPGQADYDLSQDGANGIKEFIEFDFIQGTFGSGRVTDLWQRADYDSLELDIADGTMNGDPIDWGYYGGQLRLYPVPDQIWTIRIGGHYRLNPLTTDDSQNAWTNEGYQLIRAQARARVFAFPIRNVEMAQTSVSIAQGELDRLRKETTRRTATNRIRPLRGGF